MHLKPLLSRVGLVLALCLAGSTTACSPAPATLEVESAAPGSSVPRTLTATPVPTDTAIPELTLTPVVAIYTPTAAPSASPTFTVEIGSTTIPTATVAASNFELIDFTQTVQVFTHASLSLQAEPGAQCALAYRTPNGNLSRAAGLGEQSADEQGRCRWEWMIGSSTQPGTGQVQVTVNGQAQSFAITIVK